MLSLYLVRHGQTDASLGNRFCGRIDPPLNATGVAMAEALAARYGREGFVEVAVSPLARALKTAEPTARLAGLPLTVDDDLVEIAYGDWEGRAEADVERDDHERFAAWAAHPGRVAPPGGETGAEIARRALAAVERIRARHPAGGKVLVVSHKATLRVLVCALVGVDVDLFRARIAQKVCAISIIDFKPSGPLLQVLGDTSHLPPALLAGDGT
jgi:probable phosphoglycerate mutase